MGAPLGEVEAMRAERAERLTRRQILAGSAVGAAALIAPRRSFAIGAPRVAIVGGGIAGLMCARELWRHGRVAAQIYEWDDHVGGRVQTLRDYFVDGQLAEQHGEFISSEHAETLKLARHFGLALENTYHAPQGTKDTYWFNGERYTQHDLNQDWQGFGYQLFRDAARKAPRATYLHYSKAAYAWDHQSVAEWIDENVPGGLSRNFGKLCYADVIDEYGGPPENQSALNLIYILGFDDSRKSDQQHHTWPLLAGTDERWHLKGGNDQLISGLVSELPDGTINFGFQLEALAENADGSFTCTFANSTEAVVDHVVIAIPFTTLRNVDLTRVTLSLLKQQAIAALQLGNNAKIHIQVAGRPWTNDGFNGDQLTDAAPDGGWDASSYQKLGKKAEIYGCLPGGTDGLTIGPKYGLTENNFAGPAPAALVADTLTALEPIFPGMTAAWNTGPQLAWVNDGNLDPHLLGAWSQYNVGQYTSFGGSEGLPEGNVHFAGEHTSYEFQGFIEGAVRSGQRAAREILRT